jgi:hypothetical protein
LVIGPHWPYITVQYCTYSIFQPNQHNTSHLSLPFTCTTSARSKNSRRDLLPVHFWHNCAKSSTYVLLQRSSRTHIQSMMPLVNRTSSSMSSSSANNLEASNDGYSSHGSKGIQIQIINGGAGGSNGVMDRSGHSETDGLLPSSTTNATSEAATKGVMLREVCIAFMVLLGGWYGPRQIIVPHIMGGVRQRPIPYQVVNGDVILDFDLLHPLVPKDQVLVPCESAQVLYIRSVLKRSSALVLYAELFLFSLCAPLTFMFLSPVFYLFYPACDPAYGGCGSCLIVHYYWSILHSIGIFDISHTTHST